MIKRSNSEISLGDAIREFIEQNGLENGMDKAKIISSWEKVTGRLVAKHTLDLSFEGSILYVKVDSAALKQELMHQRSKIIKKLNKVVDKSVVSELVVN